ncbi:RNA-directed DNA polymerase from mobile element jockey [Trichonephila clavipes]|nr:RNA-directed DNA polymerase from mobile element jockey [Trichonephila clavipes]
MPNIHQSWGCYTNNDRGNDLLNAADDGALIFLNSGLPTHTSFSYGNFKHLKSYFQHRDHGLRTLILKRNALHRKLTLTGDREDKVELNKLNASIKQLYIKLKREAWSGLCSNIDAKTPNTKLWKLAQSLSYNQPQNMPCNTVLTSDGKAAPDDKTAANVLG